ncbi:hypothetical protein [Pseudoalteromonas luteoviolacea]|uniref:Uncharacterized protein n=1 Tax=Pseudoalteromonas luteoviolacea (strain 2ta16) TaxID=1353533 RepID=V4JDB5_PSEL2|nr:hypothetical protein [Pseudoalteromonas luteoviolacea]ESP93077.1 hypothetical protein PL2TA16_03709 [Pseudoalteromonas luteoviolacea 2ta16]KZN43109.1 hypothetical protein N483_09325 [Pseudoalteromonas luteoviolacea NCIMB 1944]
MEEEQKITLEQYLAELRLIVDLRLTTQYPYFSEKPYPLGRCKEIRNAMLELLQTRLAMPTLPAPLQILKNELNLGQTLKPAWGSLRDEYFQNAILLGDWYIDTANDTVNPNKPRVEIVKLEQSGFSAITSFEQFCLIARKYWQVTIYKNDIYPALAPYLPLVCVNNLGASWLAAANDDMIALARKSCFVLSERILNELPSTPTPIKQHWYRRYSDHTDYLLKDTAYSAAEFCQRYREQHKEHDLLFRDEVVKAYLLVAQGASVA